MIRSATLPGLPRPVTRVVLGTMMLGTRLSEAESFAVLDRAFELGLTALDLLGAMVVVDRAKLISDSKYDKLSANDKLARLLGVLKLTNAIPPMLTNLTVFAAVNAWSSGIGPPPGMIGPSPSSVAEVAPSLMMAS